MQTFGEETNRLKSLIEEKMKHAFIEKFIDKPLIDLDKLSILQFLYSESNLFHKEKDQYIVTVMFVQIALDIHEKIQVERDETEDETKHQLYVLAGDYYSGLYYKFLAERQDITMIHRVARAIKRINEQKMRLYYSEFASDDELIESLSDIESLLYIEITDELQFSDDVKQLIRNLLLTNRLIHEKERIVQNCFSYIKQYLQQKKSYDEAKILEFLNEHIKLYANELMSNVSMLPYKYQSFKCFVQQKYKPYVNIQAVKEG